VYDFPWVDSFAAARNACLEQASCEWIFWLDADDRLDEDNRRKLHELFARLPEDNVAYSLKCKCLAAGNGSATVVDHIRLFRNDPRIRWKYRVHEQILGAVRAAGGSVVFTDITIHHTGYVDSDLRQRKLLRDLRLLDREHEEHPDDPFTLFNLGATHLELGRASLALPLLQRSLARSGPRDSIVRKLYALIASCHLALGRPEEALRACAEGLAACPDDAELLLLEGVVRTDQGDLHGARAALVRLLNGSAGPHFASVADGLRGHKARHQLAVVSYRLGEHDEAEALWRAALREAPGLLPAWLGLAALYLTQQHWGDLEGALAQLEGLPGGACEAALLRGKAMLARGELAQARAGAEYGLKRWPDFVPLWLLLSHALLKQGDDPAAARHALEEVLRLDPDNPQARHNLAALNRQTRS
jgi:tetratricopeptide (TPR) repeat protein